MCNDCDADGDTYDSDDDDAGGYAEDAYDADGDSYDRDDDDNDHDDVVKYADDDDQHDADDGDLDNDVKYANDDDDQSDDDDYDAGDDDYYYADDDNDDEATALAHGPTLATHTPSSSAQTDSMIRSLLLASLAHLQCTMNYKCVSIRELAIPLLWAAASSLC